MRAAQVVSRVPYLTRTMQPFEILSEEALATIEYTADTVLEEVGIEVRDYPSALTLFKNAGAIVDGTRGHGKTLLPIGCHREHRGRPRQIRTPQTAEQTDNQPHPRFLHPLANHDRLSR